MAKFTNGDRLYLEYAAKHNQPAHGVTLWPMIGIAAVALMAVLAAHTWLAGMNEAAAVQIERGMSDD